MDIQKKKVEKSYFSMTKIKIGFGIIIALSIVIYFATSWKASVDRKQVIFGTVKFGDLSVEVEGYGELKSNKQRLITSSVDATVKEIVLKPGAVVAPDSLIAKLENPVLQQNLISAQQRVMQVEAEYRQLVVNLQREALAEDSELAEIEGELAVAKKYLDAQRSVFGKGAVSKLEYERSQATVSQLEKRLNFKKNSQAQLKVVHKESLLIQDEKINQTKGELTNIQGQLDLLLVVAGIDGMLQRLPIELGQGIKAGQELALVGGTKDLVAILNVPQTQAGLLSVGMSAKIDNRTEKIEGVVERIDPSVTNNTVAVEVKLLGVFSGARVGQSVDGAVTVETISQTTYMERPVGVPEKSSRILFQLDESGTTATKKEVKFGKSSGRYIQILSPVVVGEKFILSDLSSIVGNGLNIKN